MRIVAVVGMCAACAHEPDDTLFASGRGPGPVALHSSSIAVSPDGSTVYVVNADTDSVSVIDVASRRLAREIALGDIAPALDPSTQRYDPRVGPRALALSPAARRLYVTGQRSGTLYVIDLATLRVTSRLAVGSEPVGVLVAPDERSVYVACASDAHVVRVDAMRRSVVTTVSTAPKPWALAWSSDRTTLHVSHLLGPGVSTFDATTLSAHGVIAVEAIARESDARLPNGEARGLYDVVARPGDGALWIPHLLLSTTTAQRPLARGLELNFETTVFPALSVLRDGRRAAWMSVASMAVAPAVRRRFGMQHITSGPHALDFTPDGRYALVVNAQSDDLMVIDAVRNVEVPGGLVRPIGGHMPEGIVVSRDGARAFVDLRNSMSVAVLRLVSTAEGLDVRIEGEPIGRVVRDPMPQELRTGQRVFFSANSSELPITQNFWVACASCHLEGRSDAVTWRFKPGPRDTPSNAGGMVGLGPLLRTGQRARVEDYWRTITEEHGGDGAAFDRDPALRPYLTALAAYVNRAIPWPIAPRTDTARVARGRVLFEDARVGCATCHSGPLLTDSAMGTATSPRLYDVGTCNTDPAWPDRAHTADDGSARMPCHFDTPTLRGVADSAPYLHDGSAPTLRAVLERTRGRMGNIEGLSSEDLDALVEYMRSL